MINSESDKKRQKSFIPNLIEKSGEITTDLISTQSETIVKQILKLLLEFDKSKAVSDKYSKEQKEKDLKKFFINYIRLIRPFFLSKPQQIFVEDIENESSCHENEYENFELYLKLEQCEAEPQILRISYIAITKYIYEDELSKSLTRYEIENVHNNLELIIENKTLPFNGRKMASKILDHLELCSYQNDYMKYKIDKSKVNIDELSAEIKTKNEEISMLSNKVTGFTNDIINQVLVALSIFTGLSFIIFGGLDILGGLTKYFDILTTNFSLGIIYLSLVGLILLGLIHTLLSFVIRIINRDKYDIKDDDANENENSKKKKTKKYKEIPLISYQFWLIFSILVIMVIIGLGIYFNSDSNINFIIKL